MQVKSTMTVFALVCGFAIAPAMAAEKKHDPESFTITKAKEKDVTREKNLRQYKKGDAHESEMSRRIARYESE